MLALPVIGKQLEMRQEGLVMVAYTTQLVTEKEGRLRMQIRDFHR